MRLGKSQVSSKRDCPGTSAGLLVATLSGVKSLSDVGDILRSSQDDTSPKAGRGDRQNALGAAALRQRGVQQRWGRRQVCNQVCHFVGKAGSMAARQPRRGGVPWDIFGLKTSHFETFQSWTLRNVSHFETFESWRRDKASHFESFRGWRRDKASHFESSGGWRLREVSHVSHFAGLGLHGLRPGVVRASGCAFTVPGLGQVPRGPLVVVRFGAHVSPVFDGTEMP